MNIKTAVSINSEACLGTYEMMDIANNTAPIMNTAVSAWIINLLYGRKTNCSMVWTYPDFVECIIV